MPGWDGELSDDDMWKTVLFVKNSGKVKNEGQQQSSPSPSGMDNSKRRKAAEIAASSQPPAVS